MSTIPQYIVGRFAILYVVVVMGLKRAMSMDGTNIFTELGTPRRAVISHKAGQSNPTEGPRSQRKMAQRSTKLVCCKTMQALLEEIYTTYGGLPGSANTRKPTANSAKPTA